VSRVPLIRALSKLGILSRSQAITAVRAGRVRIDGRIVSNPAVLVVPERVRVEVDGQACGPAAWRTIVLYKPRGVVTTRRDPDGRPTIYDVVGEAARGLASVGRLDLATSGLLLLTSDTRLGNWLTDPSTGIDRVYVVTVRGDVSQADADALTSGVVCGGERLRAHAVTIRKGSARESHLIVQLREGRNREVRRLFDAIGHEVTRLKRVQFGGLGLDGLSPGQWRDLTRRDVRALFPGAPLRPAQGRTEGR
jgi:23S rRNA pseudouridine2605 synthase